MRKYRIEDVDNFSIDDFEYIYEEWVNSRDALAKHLWHNKIRRQKLKRARFFVWEYIERDWKKLFRGNRVGYILES